MLNRSEYTVTNHSSNLLFMRRRQAAQLLLSLAEGDNQNLPAKNLLLDALYQLPTQCFIADDWSVILEQVTHTLLLQGSQNGARMPTRLNELMAQIVNRLECQSH